MTIVSIQTNDYEGNVEIEEGQSVAGMLQHMGIAMPYTCGGKGICKGCRIKAGGVWRTACTLYPKEDITITEFGWETAAREQYDIVNIASDDSRAREAAGEIGTCILAIDIGTTTIAAALVDEKNKTVVDTLSMLNSQRQYGADVLSRIKASVSGNQVKLQKLIRADVHTLCEEFKKRWNHAAIAHIYIAGNTTMEHLYMGDSCEGLGKAPFTPVSLLERQSMQDDIPVTLLPGISAFVGADIAAGMLECSLDTCEAPTLFVDLGTNGEMVLCAKGHTYTTSAPAGPAFEGGNISCGTGSVLGAICKIKVIYDRNIYRTIGNKPAVGLCGTGVIELAAELLYNKSIDLTGRMYGNIGESGYELGKREDGSPILFTQQDLRELQMAKAAIRSGMDILIDKAKLSPDDIEHVYLAGGFGYHLDVDKAVRIGLLPEEWASGVQSVGNASLQGCIMYALDKDAKDRLRRMTEQAEEINLANEAAFEACYLSHMNFR